MRHCFVAARSGLIAIAAIVSTGGSAYWSYLSAAPLDNQTRQGEAQLAEAAPPPIPVPPRPPTDLGPAPKLDEFVLYAQRSITLAGGEPVVGNVGVHAAALGLSGSQLHVGGGAKISKLLIAPSVDVASGVTFAMVLANQFIDAGSPAAAQPFPAVNMPPLPYLRMPPAAGSNPINVPAGGAMTLGPGNYGALMVGQLGLLRLQPGEYIFSQVTLGDQAKVLADVGAAPNQGSAIIRVLGKFTAVRNALIRPIGAQNLPASAGHLFIFVYGSAAGRGDPNGGAIGDASIGQGSDVTALIAAPRGTLAIDSNVVATGAFAGYNISVSEATKVTLQDGFPNNLAEQLGSQKLEGYLPTHPDMWPVIGPVPLDKEITLTVGLPVRTPVGFPTLKDAIKQASDPKQPATFRHFLTPADFKTRYGATDADYNALTAWAASNGLATKTFSNNLLVSVSGTAAQFERVLNAFLIFRQRSDGSSFVSVDRNPSLDLAVPILEIGNLNSFIVPRADVTVNGHGVAGAGQLSSYQAKDLREAYLGGLNPFCAPLTGAGQVVGIVGFSAFSPSDVQAYDNTNGITASSPIVVLADGGLFGPGLQTEATIDVEMVHALAPDAQILFFQGDALNVEPIYHHMATSIQPLTVASSSMSISSSQNLQQALDEMAMQGTVFFQASGDLGNVRDPRDNHDLENQTLVGGTSLSTNPLIGSSKDFPTPYYASETTWNQTNQNPPANQASGGGIMDGNTIGPCFFCSPVDIPDYQIATQQQNAVANGGSTTARNYPDVALTAASIEVFVGGGKLIARGTSAAAPLWAAFAALAGEKRSEQGNEPFLGALGPLNRTLYDIGQTRGSADDLYAATFNDINDGSNNAAGNAPGSFPAGFPAVAGYDLATGWGTPTCNLLTQLGSPAPLTNTTPLVELEFIIGTGHDDLRSDSLLTADIVLPDGVTHLTGPLHPHNSAEWPNFDSDQPNGKPRTILGIAVPKWVAMQITPINPIKQVTLRLTQGDFNCLGNSDCDNWDMTGLRVNAFSGLGQRVCQVNLVGNSTLDDDSTGLFRFKDQFDPDCGGLTRLCGPFHAFTGGCQ